MSDYRLRRLFKADGTWDAFRGNWNQQYANVDDNADEYASEALKIVEEFAGDSKPNVWAYAVCDGETFLAAFMLNRAQLPETTGWTLRVRHVVVSPNLDFGIVDQGVYADVLVALLAGVVQLSESSHRAEHVKFHLRSPHDMAFFHALGSSLDKQSVFSSVQKHGAWLSITKR